MTGALYIFIAFLVGNYRKTVAVIVVVVVENVQGENQAHLLSTTLRPDFVMQSKIIAAHSVGSYAFTQTRVRSQSRSN